MLSKLRPVTTGLPYQEIRMDSDIGDGSIFPEETVGFPLRRNHGTGTVACRSFECGSNHFIVKACDMRSGYADRHFRLVIFHRSDNVG